MLRASKEPNIRHLRIKMTRQDIDVESLTHFERVTHPVFDLNLMHPEFVAAMEMASAGKSPISPYLESKFFRKVLSKIRAGEPLPNLTNYFLWTVSFVGAWLQQVDTVSTEGQPFMQLVHS